MGSDKCFNMELQAFFVLLGLATLISGADLGGGHGGNDHYEYSPYHYEYKVDDDKEYLRFGQEERMTAQGMFTGIIMSSSLMGGCSVLTTMSVATVVILLMSSMTMHTMV